MPERPYRSQWWSAFRAGFTRRIGGRWGVPSGIIVAIVAAILGFAIAGEDRVSADGVRIALFAAVGAVLVWMLVVAVFSAVMAPAELETVRNEVQARLIHDRERGIELLEAERNHARSELNDLQDQLRPVFRFRPGAVGEIGSRSASAFLEVTNVSDGEARNCRGRLVALGAVGRERRLLLDIPLSWAQPDSPSDPSRKSFYGLARLNVAVNATPNYMGPAAAFPLDAIDRDRSELSRDADLLLGIEVSADNTPATIGWFHLKWWSHIILKEPETGNDIYYLLDHAQITFEDVDDKKPAAP
jgi:hypothetical protein